MLVRRIFGLTVMVAVPGGVLLALGPGRPVPDDVLGGVAGLTFLGLGVAFAAVGAIIAPRVPGNPIGVVFALTGLLATAGVLAWAYAVHGLHAGSGRPPLTALAAAFPSELLAAMFGVAILLFPDGRLPSRRWRPAAGVLVVSGAFLAVSDVLRPGPLDPPFAELVNPLGVPGLRAALDVVNGVGWLLVVVGIVLAGAALVARLRRAHGAERQQLKLVLAVGAVVALVAAVDMSTWLIWPHGHQQARIAVVGLGFGLFPVAAGVAILRFRLYDIDVAINRALVYGAVTATLAAAYASSVLLLQLVLSPSSDLAIAGSTLAVAALFRPARTRIQTLVDRRFFRQRYDARHTLERFGARMRDEVDLDMLAQELTDTVGTTIQPAHVSLWMRGGGG